ncbi:MAG: glutamate-5-semialdehyde dehydrogenase [Verrucomicrobiota bacterium]|nr:glutamate-5-semialdehyde dehydrogenase [Verrucomicrobiota bacterium]
MDVHHTMLEMGDKAVAAARQLTLLGTRRKNLILEAMADSLEANRAQIKEANARDMAAGRAGGLTDAMLDRLFLTDKRMDSIIHAVRALVGLKDPVGQKISRWIRPNGLIIQKVRVPIGVIGIIFESRPNVTVDAAALCFKTSNAVILRGGREALESNMALVEALQTGGARKGLPADSIQLITTTDHDAVRELVQLEGRVDLIIPRGGEKLIRAVTQQAHVPVIKHYKGVCYVYVDQAANQEMALNIIENAKCSRPGVCNAIEKVLVHQAIAAEFLPKLAARLSAQRVEIRGDEGVRAIVPSVTAAREEDWVEEYLDLILAVGITPGVEEAIAFINKHGSHHSDAIISEEEAAQNLFSQQVDSACVYTNASTRFTDGAEFGMGAEIGISTDKLHARGPMGLEELTTYKYIIHGHGQIRE